MSTTVRRGWTGATGIDCWLRGRSVECICELSDGGGGLELLPVERNLLGVSCGYTMPITEELPESCDLMNLDNSEGHSVGASASFSGPVMVSIKAISACFSAIVG